jgi:hypothetical protein
MVSYIFIALTNAVKDRDAEFNRWYNEQHLPDVLRIPGMVAAQRFVLAPDQRMEAPHPYRYLAIYEIDADDPAQVIADVQARAGTELMPMTDAIAAERLPLIFQPLTDRRTA